MALTDRVINLINTIPLFRGFDDTEVEAFLGFTTSASYSSKSIILKEGEKGKRLYIIERGVAGVITPIHVREDLKKPLEQKYKILAQLCEGDFFGEIGLFTSNPRSASILAKSVVEVICLGENERDDLENRQPVICCKFYHNLIGEMAKRLLSSNEIIREYYRAVNPGLKVVR